MDANPHSTKRSLETGTDSKKKNNDNDEDAEAADKPRKLGPPVA
jgi:hypothetical protein